jgi:hypothetical protein
MDDTAHRATRSTLLTLHGLHPTVGVLRPRLQGSVVPTDWIGAKPLLTYPSVVHEALLTPMIQTTLPNVERWMMTTVASHPSVGVLSAQIRTSPWTRPSHRRHLGPREPWMTSVVCQACHISIRCHSRLIRAPPDFHFPGQRRREPLPSQSHRYKEASELAARPSLSGSNRVLPQTQHR